LEWWMLRNATIRGSQRSARTLRSLTLRQFLDAISSSNLLKFNTLQHRIEIHENTSFLRATSLLIPPSTL
ncbi:MAG: hypothetical protein O7G85_17405, partial [Planctomycetota bacterium]|nr:hypothetical protein [Planctomycetota bacterium]